MPCCMFSDNHEIGYNMKDRVIPAPNYSKHKGALGLCMQTSNLSKKFWLKARLSYDNSNSLKCSGIV